MFPQRWHVLLRFSGTPGGAAFIITISVGKNYAQLKEIIIISGSFMPDV